MITPFNTRKLYFLEEQLEDERLTPSGKYTTSELEAIKQNLEYTKSTYYREHSIRIPEDISELLYELKR